MDEATKTDDEAAREIQAAREKDCEDALEAFRKADADYKEEQNGLLAGDVVVGLAETMLVSDSSLDYVRTQWVKYLEQLQQKLEDRNAKLKTVQLKLRDLVKLGEHEERGPGAKPVTITKGEFKVNSVTGRSFDINTLLQLAERFEVKDQMLALTTDKDGFPLPVLRQVWEVDYDYLLTWLKARQLHGVINGAYKEMEKTPAVSGPKPLAFFGNELK